MIVFPSTDSSPALILIPRMGRCKYSYGGKLHGRNEMITRYLWIAYLQSLAPGATPDPSMARTRKQVSSHIQVLKAFLKGHPASKISFLVRWISLTPFS
jgi:transcriptional enhancer factor